MKTIYDFDALQFNGTMKSLGDFEGKVLLVVNTASQCLFTRQFKSLEKLYQKYKERGFEVLAFPSNNFRNQEPLTGSTLETFCRINQQVSFPVFKRSHVIGTYTTALYSFLSNKAENGHINSNPSWNFHKFLINRQGEVVDFYYPTTSPLSGKICRNIERLLEE